MKKEKILEFAKKEGYCKIKYLGKWEKYDVYDLIDENEEKGIISFVGYPYVLLVEGENIRVSTDEESLKARDRLIENDDEDI